MLGYRFGATVGQFCLLAGLRAQVSPGREGEFKEVSQERYVANLGHRFRPVSIWRGPLLTIFSAFADFCLSSVVLHVFAFNFLG